MAKRNARTLGAIAALAIVCCAACKDPPRSPSCDVATFLCLNVPCDDGGTSVENCPQIGLDCAIARDTCPRQAEVASCLDALAGATLSCPDADVCFTRVGCRWVGVLPSDGGVDGGVDGGLIDAGSP